MELDRVEEQFHQLQAHCQVHTCIHLMKKKYIPITYTYACIATIIIRFWPDINPATPLKLMLSPTVIFTVLCIATEIIAG